MRPLTAVTTATGLLAAAIAAVSVHAAPPPAPQLSVAVGGAQVSLSWSAPGAGGYELSYAPYPNQDTTATADVGAATRLDVTLAPGAAYYVAVRARNRDGLSGYSNIATAFVPSGGVVALQAGDYWDFEWSETVASSSPSGSSTTARGGTFRVSLGAQRVLGGRAAYELRVTGQAGPAAPVWKFVAADGPRLLGTVDGGAYAAISRSDGTPWLGAGFFRFFPPDRTAVSSSGSYAGNYRTTPASIVARATSRGGCTYYAEVGQTICGEDTTSYAEREFHKAGALLPIGYRYESSAVFSGGGFGSAHRVLRTVELVKSSRVADDGSIFTGSPWQPLPRPPAAFTAQPWVGTADGRVHVFGDGWTSAGGPKVQTFDPAAGTWSMAAPGAQVTLLFGASRGALVALGTLSRLGAPTLLRFDAGMRRWQAMPGTPPRLSNPCGAAVVASGDLVAVDCPTTASPTAHVYRVATGSWTAGVALGGTALLRPAVAAVGDALYLAGGYRVSAGSISGEVRRFDTRTRAWEPVRSPLPTPRDNASAVAVGSRLYVIGGWGATSDVPRGRVVEVFDTALATWSSAPPMAEPRLDFGIAAAADAVYIVGGRDSANAWLGSALRWVP